MRRTSLKQYSGIVNRIVYTKQNHMVSLSFYLVLLFISINQPSYAYIPIFTETKSIFDRELEKSTRHMAQGARIEVEGMMQTLFDTQLRPFLYEFDAMLGEKISQGDEAAKRRLDQVHEIIREMMGGIERQLVSIDSLRAQFVTDINRLQSDILDNFRCAADGAIEKAASKMSELRDSFRLTLWERHVSRREYYSKLDACYTKLGLNYEVEEWQYGQLYDIKKCMAMDRINMDSKVSVIMNTYLDLRNYSQSMRCVQYGARDVSDHKYSQEFLELGRKYNIWRFVTEI